jgi:hypothetical protein
MPSPTLERRWVYRFFEDTGLQSLLLEEGEPNPAGEAWHDLPDEAQANPEKPPKAKGKTNG